MLNASHLCKACWCLAFSAFLILANVQGVMGAACSGATYDSTAFQEEVTLFSPYDTIYLILSCSNLIPGEYTMHVNWVHHEKGIIRSDKHDFVTESSEKRGVYFWFKLSKKGPMASMFTNQDFHEGNFGQWSVETYLEDELVLTRSFSIEDGIR